MTPREFLKNKSVLVVGLGILGGGVATTKWLVKHGAKLTVTDLKSRRELAHSIKELGSAAKRVRFVLDRHNSRDFITHDFIVLNPAISLSSPYVKVARKAKIPLENELTLFLRFCKNPVIGVTGTKGKTTTATWIRHFLKRKFPKSVLTGNTAENPLLGALDKLDGKTPVVAELSSFQLELLPSIKKSPHIAVLTNLMRDHLNRHSTMREYARAKENIFKYQKKGDVAIRPNFLASARLGFKILPSFGNKWGEHNVTNLRVAALAAHKAGVSWDLIKKAVNTLPNPRFRQQIIFKSAGPTIINDSTATTPDAVVAAIKRFSRSGVPIILIAGGTDKNLDFRSWAGIVKRTVAPEHLILLEGSATTKMLAALPRSFQKRVRTFRTLERCVSTAVQRAHLVSRATVLFSPGGASFEKFKNEFDRGEKFNRLIRKIIQKRRA